VSRFLPVLSLALAASLFLFTGAGLAAEHGGGGGEHHASLDLKTLGLQLLNFGILLFILVKFGGGAINKALQQRHDQLKADLDEANRIRTAAETKFKAQEKRLANLEQELAAMRAAIVQDAENEKARIVAAAQEKAQRIQQETTFQLQQQVKEAEARFRLEVAQAASRVADELLRKSVTPSDEQRLSQTFVAELGADGGRPRGPGPEPDKGGQPRPPRPREEVQS
jgi:F-type H+-transporting ATPase subunit b